MFSSNHIRHWESHLACEAQVALNDTVLLVSEISVSIRQVSCNMPHMCARLRTAGLPISLTWGLRHNFCCRGPILSPRPVLESSAQTTRVNVLDFL